MLCMGRFERHPGGWILLTGATGFVGQGLVRELISRGHRVLCVVRAESPAAARQRLIDALRPWELDGDLLMEQGAIAVLRGDLDAPCLSVSCEAAEHLRGRVTQVVHAAGSTRFSENSSGDPARTNIAGARHAWELAAALDCRDWHFVSTAYVAGRRDSAEEVVHTDPTPLRNAYERSKWQAEHDALAAAQVTGAVLTIHRPSIVVGEGTTGRATRFAAAYYLMRATGLVARWAAQHAEVDRHMIPLSIPADPDGEVNLIAIDDLARGMADLIENPQARGGVYHLTHPQPPTHGQLKRVLEEFYDIGGGSFRSDRAGRPTDHCDVQEVFDDLTATVGDYLFSSTRFERCNTQRYERRQPAAWTPQRLRRLVQYAESVGWRSGGTIADRSNDDAAGIIDYFREFLPSRATAASLGAIRDLNVDVQFRIGSNPWGCCWCRLRGGVPVETRVGQYAADVEYRTGVAEFWRAVAGEVSGAELFLSGGAEISGDVERGLKLAMLLEGFVRQFPYRRGSACLGAAS